MIRPTALNGVVQLDGRDIFWPLRGQIRYPIPAGLEPINNHLSIPVVPALRLKGLCWSGGAALVLQSLTLPD